MVMPNMQGTNPMDNNFGGGEMPQFTPGQYQPTPPEPEMPNPEAQEQKEQVVALQKKNLAEDMDEQELIDIGKECKQGLESDIDSRSEWYDQTQEWMKLACQVREQKTYPWPNASNVKYPLISTAAMQFAARAYPTLVPADGKLVKTKMWGKDLSGEKRKKGDRIATFMSWQFVEDIGHWEEDMDKLLITVPVTGVVFKKTYYNPITEKVDSDLVYPENFFIDYWAQSIEKCERYSELIYMTPKRVKERQLAGYFLDIDLGVPSNNDPNQGRGDNARDSRTTDDFTLPYPIIEQYTWLDLDEDGLREPYLVTFEYNTGKILRISARFKPEDILMGEDGKPIAFVTGTCFTKFGFIPNPDGSFYDLGFGHLLGPINESVNSIINQLIDAGTLSNLQAGFIGKGLRIKMGETAFKPGEWKAVNATGDDLKKQIVPLPANAPSDVLFKLLGQLITSGKELASVAEIFTGKMPGQNTPATTTMATVEQGMKVFTAIYKRIYRALAKEYKKVFCLNNYYLDPQTYAEVLDEPINPEDFDESVYDVCPTADPTATTQAEKMQKAQALMELLPLGILDPMKVVMRLLEAQEQPQWEELIPGMAETGQPTPPQPKPDPKLEAQKMKAQTDQQMLQAKMQNDERKAQMDMAMKSADLQMKQNEAQIDIAHKQQMNQLEASSKAQMNEIFMAEAKAKAMATQVGHAQKLTHSEQDHQQKLKQAKEKPTGKANRK